MLVVRTGFEFGVPDMIRTIPSEAMIRGAYTPASHRHNRGTNTMNHEITNRVLVRARGCTTINITSILEEISYQ